MKQTAQLLTISRRHALAMLGAAGATVFAGVPAYADGAAVAAKIKGLTGGKSVGEGKIELDLPEIAENGNAVKVAFSIDSPMTIIMSKRFMSWPMVTQPLTLLHSVSRQRWALAVHRHGCA